MDSEIPDKNEAGKSYVVRVLLRRNKDDQIVGVVESLDSGARHAFIDRDELWGILIGVDE